MCVFLFVHMCVGTHACKCACRGQRSTLDVVPPKLPTLFSHPPNRVSHWDLGFIDLARLAGQGIPRILSFCLPELRKKVCVTMFAFYVRGRDRTYSKYFIDLSHLSCTPFTFIKAQENYIIKANLGLERCFSVCCS